jgi:hypothetical protein
MVDKPWEEGAIKVRKAQVPVVPIYFHAKIVGYFTSFLKLAETFRTALSSFSQIAL